MHKDVLAFTLTLVVLAGGIAVVAVAADEATHDFASHIDLVSFSALPALVLLVGVLAVGIVFAGLRRAFG